MATISYRCISHEKTLDTSVYHYYKYQIFELAMWRRYLNCLSKCYLSFTLEIKEGWSIWESLLLFVYSSSLSFSSSEVIIIINKCLFFLSLSLRLRLSHIDFGRHTSVEDHPEISRGCVQRKKIKSSKRTLVKYAPVLISINKWFHSHLLVHRSEVIEKEFEHNHSHWRKLFQLSMEFHRWREEIEYNRFFVFVYSSRSISVVNCRTSFDHHCSILVFLFVLLNTISYISMDLDRNCQLKCKRRFDLLEQTLLAQSINFDFMHRKSEVNWSRFY